MVESVLAYIGASVIVVAGTALIFYVLYRVGLFR